MRAHRTFLPLQILTFLVFASCAQAQDWPTFRHDNARTGTQPVASILSNPQEVGMLSVRWAFPGASTAAQVGQFSAAPIVVGDTVFIGNQNGYFYALDAATGMLKWQYPPAGQPALLGATNQFLYPGIKSSAAYWDRQPNGAVIFTAQDPSLGPFGADGKPYGSARLLAVDAKDGTLIWASDPIAEINGLTNRSNTEVHERIEHSPPLVLDNVVYVGVQNFDNPTQIGRIVAVDITTGHRIPASRFQFQAVGTPASPPGTVRGGGIWNGPATDGDDIYFTTGNTNRDNGDPPLTTEPNPNHGVSMVKIDKASGKIKWAYKTVPFSSECDSDWAAGATVMDTSCGRLIASVQKDGWSYAIEAASTPSCPLTGHSWQFPPTTKGCMFPPNTCSPDQDQDTAAHGDDDYRRPGAAWNDVFVVRTGGESRVQDGVTVGYSRLHALNACAATESTRVRWIADVPSSSGDVSSVGAPTVTGGIVFVGTNQGHLVVFADPSVAPAAGWRCSNVDYLKASDCTAAGYSLVPIPQTLADVQVWDGGSLTAIRTEPVLANGRVFVATAKGDNGHVYMLQP
jgi:outer membrane protein assembly factor BamB